jgi:hypothetical protein
MTTRAQEEDLIKLKLENYSEWMKAFKLEMTAKKISNSVREIISKLGNGLVDMKAFNTQTTRVAAVTAEENRMVEVVNQLFQSRYAQLHEAARTPVGGAATAPKIAVAEKNALELANQRIRFEEVLSTDIGILGKMVLDMISPEIESTMIACTYGHWKWVAGQENFKTLDGIALLWMIFSKFREGSVGKPQNEVRLRNLIKETMQMATSDLDGVHLNLQRLRLIKGELSAEEVTADQLIEAICKHPIVYDFQHSALSGMQDDAEDVPIKFDELLAKATSKVTMRRTRNRVEEKDVVAAIEQPVTKVPVAFGNIEQHQNDKKKEFYKRIRETFKLSKNECTQCGLVHVWSGTCPNIKEKCDSCGNGGHTSKVCLIRYKQVNKVDSAYINKLSSIIHISNKIQKLGDLKQQKELQKSLNIGDLRDLVLVDTGCSPNIQVVSSNREDFEDLIMLETETSISGLGESMVVGEGNFMGVLKGKYCPKSKLITSVMSETMLTLKGYKITLHCDEGRHYKIICRPSNAQNKMRVDMHTNGMYYIKKYNVREFFLNEKREINSLVVNEIDEVTVQIEDEDNEGWEEVKRKKKKVKLTPKQLTECRAIHASMGHMRPNRMVKSIEAKAVVLPKHITLDLVKRYAEYNEVCAACNIAGMKKYPAHEDREEKAKVPGTWHIDVHKLPVPGALCQNHFLDVIDEYSSMGYMIELWSKTSDEIARELNLKMKEVPYAVTKIYADDEPCLHLQGHSKLEGVEVINRIPGRHEKFCERYIQEINKNERALVADSQYSLEKTCHYNEIRKAAYIAHNNGPNHRSGALTPRQMVGDFAPLHLEGKGAQLKFGALVQFEVSDHAPVGSMKARAEFGVLLGPDQTHGRHGYRILCKYKGTRDGDRITVRSNIVGLPSQSHMIEGFLFNKDYSPPEREVQMYSTGNQDDDDILARAGASMSDTRPQREIKEKLHDRVAENLRNRIVTPNTSEEQKMVEVPEPVKEVEITRKEEVSCVPTNLNGEMESASIDVAKRTSGRARSSTRNDNYSYGKNKNTVENTALPMLNTWEINAMMDEDKETGIYLIMDGDDNIVYAMADPANPDIQESLKTCRMEMTVGKALQHEKHAGKLEDATIGELRQLKNKGVLVAVKKLPPDAILLPARMLCVLKTLANGEFDKAKSRLVAGGHRDPYNPDLKTASPVASDITIKILVHIACEERDELSAGDVGSAYLHIDMIRKNVYMRMAKDVPQRMMAEAGFEESDEFFRIDKCLYGLRESGLEFYKELRRILIEDDWVPSQIDPCLFMKRSIGGRMNYIATFVDDLLMLGDKETKLKAIVALRKRFEEVKYEEVATSYLGYNIEYKRIGDEMEIKVNQLGVAKAYCEQHGIIPARKGAAPFSMEMFEKAALDTRPGDQKEYASGIGALMHICKSRSDVQTSTSMLSQHQQQPFGVSCRIIEKSMGIHCKYPRPRIDIQE